MVERGASGLQIIFSLAGWLGFSPYGCCPTVGFVSVVRQQVWHQSLRMAQTTKWEGRLAGIECWTC